MRALRTAASGMSAQQLNVEVISNNIATRPQVEELVPVLGGARFQASPVPCTQQLRAPAEKGDLDVRLDYELAPTDRDASSRARAPHSQRDSEVEHHSAIDEMTMVYECSSELLTKKGINMSEYSWFYVQKIGFSSAVIFEKPRKEPYAQEPSFTCILDHRGIVREILD